MIDEHFTRGGEAPRSRPLEAVADGDNRAPPRFEENPARFRLRFRLRFVLELSNAAVRLHDLRADRCGEREDSQHSEHVSHVHHPIPSCSPSSTSAAAAIRATPANALT